ncbi:hypothetical protein E5170_19735 [Pseudomonas atacamensis]|uniref:Uncharacterized protein n=1 Tax=Pseudomonas atacamensis TaxID=2565368 RepID=A0AAQ2DA11_9PSED|nr:hypothetical protein EGJ55_17075 [Pseudomonas moraviensis]THF29417.1 hypothetical protein E5170_19735 [Pseudomonas atacamensis]
MTTRNIPTPKSCWRRRIRGRFFSVNPRRGIREQARSHIGMQPPVGASLLAKGPVPATNNQDQPP